MKYLLTIILTVGSLIGTSKAVYANTVLGDTVPQGFGYKIDTEYPFLKDLIRGYYSFNYMYPDNVADIVKYIENCLMYHSYNSKAEEKMIKDITLKKLKRNAKKVSIDASDGFIMCLKNDTLFDSYTQIVPFHPCDLNLFIGDTSSEYTTFLEKFPCIKCFDKKNRAVLFSHTQDSIFEKQIIELRAEYLTAGSFSVPTFCYENDKMPIFTFLEFIPSQGLRYFCENEKKPSMLSYFQQLELFFQNLCDKYKLSRIVFKTPDYQESTP